MKYRKFGKTNFKVSEISLGAWQVGGKWGEEFSESNAIKTLNNAIDLGVNFIDTADVYENRQSERIVSQVMKIRDEEVKVATKIGRFIEQVPENYNEANLRKFTNDCLTNMQVEQIDLVQLHCPPTDVFYQPEVFEVLDALVEEGKISNYGVSVERVEEALKAIEYPNLSSIQIIFNIFRQRPAELFFKEAKRKNIGIIVRVPLASGLLTGKFSNKTAFSDQDHRGNKFSYDGETFAGVPYKVGLEAVEQLKSLFETENLTPYALKWILMHDEVSCIIPGASKYEHIQENVNASEMTPLTSEQMERITEIYNEKIKSHVHQKW